MGEINRQVFLGQIWLEDEEPVFAGGPVTVHFESKLELVTALVPEVGTDDMTRGVLDCLGFKEEQGKHFILIESKNHTIWRCCDPVFPTNLGIYIKGFMDLAENIKSEMNGPHTFLVYETDRFRTTPYTDDELKEYVAQFIMPLVEALGPWASVFRLVYALRTKHTTVIHGFDLVPTACA